MANEFISDLRTNPLVHGIALALSPDDSLHVATTVQIWTPPCAPR